MTDKLEMPIEAFAIAVSKENARLRSENERLRAALSKHVCDCISNCEWESGDVCPNWDARAALGGDQ